MVLSVLLFNKCSNTPVTENNVADIVNLEKEEPVKYIDKKGKPHIQKKVLMANIATIHAYYHAKIDSFTQALKIKDKQIAGFTEISYREEGTFYPKVTNVVDTVTNGKKKLFSWSDKYLKFEGELNEKDSAKVFYSAHNKVSFVFMNKPAGLLKLRKDVYVDAMSENPRMTFDNIRSVKVPDPKINRLGIGVFFGAGYDLTDVNLKRPRPVAGLGLSFRLN